MTKYKDWDYKEMGFKSETEMKSSIARVTEKMENPKSEIEKGIENKAEFSAMLDDRGSIDMNDLGTQLNEASRLSDLDILVHNRIIDEQRQAKLKAEQEEMNKLLSAVADNVTAENEATAQKEMQRQKEKLEDDLQKEIYSKHGVKTDKEKQLDEAYGKLLGD